MSAVAEPPRALAFVVPPLDGPPTGGTRYNRALIEALTAQGRAPEVLSIEQAGPAVVRPSPCTVWVDSLWMDTLPELRQRASPHCRVGLWTHWLPTLVSHGERPPAEALSEAEAAAIARAQAFIAPSEYLAQELRAQGVAPDRVRVLEPGTELPVPARPPSPADDSSLPARVVVVANVIEGKGILPWLEGLARRRRPGDALSVEIVGGLQMEPDYARRCIALAEHPALSGCVRLVGSRSYAACIDAVLQADLLVSASRMESYGMALADARACGRPILARAGGNVVHHVDPRHGGELVSDEDQLAAAALAVVRDRDALRERQRLAWDHRTQRPWAEVATELVEHCRGWPS